MPWVEPEVLSTFTPEQAAGWEEVYGSEYPLSPDDVPALQNSHTRVLYDSSNTPGFKILIWDGSAWTEQGKVTIRRIGDSTRFDQVLLAASVLEWSPHRGVLEVTMSTGGADQYSRERIIISLQRGWTGPRFEVYAANKQNGTPADLAIFYTPAQADANDAALKIDAADTGGYVSTAGSGSSLFTAGNVGAGTFTGENTISLLRDGGSYQVNVAVLQPGLSGQVATSTAAYGSSRNALVIQSSGGAGYISAQFGFSAQPADQIAEAEAIRNTSGSTSQVADSGASGGQAVKDTQTAETSDTLLKSSSSLVPAKYRMLARVKVDSGATGSFRPFITGQWGTLAVRTSTSTSWVWLDLGDVPSDAGANPVFAIAAWRSAGGSGAVYIDRVALIKLEDRVSSTPAYDGARDLGQRVLYELRQQPRLIARQ